MVERDAAELRPQLPGRMPELERPCGVAVDEHDLLALAFVDVVHPVIGREVEEPVLEREQVVGNPAGPAGRRDPVHAAHSTDAVSGLGPRTLTPPLGVEGDLAATRHDC